MRVSLLKPFLFFLIVGLFGFFAQSIVAQQLTGSAEPQDDNHPNLIEPVRTDSPRQTLFSFLRLQGEIETTFVAYRSDKSSTKRVRMHLLLREMAVLFDLESIPASSRREVGEDTAFYLLDIFGRVRRPDPDAFPDTSDVKGIEDTVRWRVPGTPFQILHIEDGPREGEFLFGSQTVQAAPRFFQSVRSVPLLSNLNIQSWSDAARQFTGPWIPTVLVDRIPSFLKHYWFDTPIWKVLAVIALSIATFLLLVWLHRTLDSVAPTDPFKATGLSVLRPASILAAVYILHPIFAVQIDLSGHFSTIVDVGAITLEYFAWAWTFWVVVRLLFEWLILFPRIPKESIDANLLRLLARCIGVVGAIIILAIGGQELGLPVLSLLAGLGVGGLAVALAIRPTLENLIGGIILYVDRPVRVGDFCSFGEQDGTVEQIGIRSTQLRARNRTLISIPNAQFVDMQLINWAQCDKMLINEVIGIRYETDPDQLRYVLAALRRMLHAHPRIDSETIRVRFAGYGDSSLNIAIRIYALTREWNDFHSIREDVLLRVYDLVVDAGSSFAFPSRTIYMRQDEGIDSDRAKEAATNVDDWRRKGTLPFPRLTQEEMDRLEDTLDYPPKGSPEFLGEHLDDIPSETLSAVPNRGGEQQCENDTNKTKRPKT